MLGCNPCAEKGVERFDTPGQKGYCTIGREVGRRDGCTVVDYGKKCEVGQDEDGTTESEEDAKRVGKRVASEGKRRCAR